MELQEFIQIFKKRYCFNLQEIVHSAFILGVFAGKYYAPDGHESLMVDAVNDLRSMGLSSAEIGDILERIQDLRREINENR